MKLIPKASRLVLLVLLAALAFTGCKSKKKAMELAKAQEKARMEQEAAQKKQRDEEQRKREADEQARRDAEAKEKAKAAAPSAKLGDYFNAIANSSDMTSANNNITEALGMFASPDTPVLIIISGTGSQKDYDRPTTIRSYLNYLKDQKKNINQIENLQFDSSGKITEVELRKNP